MSNTMWQPTGRVSPTLCDTRLQLHWAVQAAAGIGRTLVPSRADDSHTTFHWDAANGALLQECTGEIKGGLRIGDLSLIAVRDGAIAEELSLQGRTLDDAFAFFERMLGAKLNRPNVDLPPHPVASGAAFDASPDDLAEFARHYANAALLCSTVVGPGERVRCWPHHFDIAALMTLAGEGESAKSIGVGLSPGDASYAEPYYYINAWPSPDATDLDTLALGHWHTNGWTGAVLTATDIAGIDDQERAVRNFVAEAVQCLHRAVLG